MNGAQVDDAAAYAVQQLSSQSNSLYPFSLKKVHGQKGCREEVPNAQPPSTRRMPDTAVYLQVRRKRQAGLLPCNATVGDGRRPPPLVLFSDPCHLLLACTTCPALNHTQLLTPLLHPHPAQVLSAKLARSESGGVVHHLKLVLSHGTMPDSTYEASGLFSCLASCVPHFLALLLVCPHFPESCCQPWSAEPLVCSLVLLPLLSPALPLTLRLTLPLIQLRWRLPTPAAATSCSPASRWSLEQRHAARSAGKGQRKGQRSQEGPACLSVLLEQRQLAQPTPAQHMPSVSHRPAVSASAIHQQPPHVSKCHCFASIALRLLYLPSF